MLEGKEAMTKRILLGMAALALTPLAASAIEVVRAEYGALNTWVDVTACGSTFEAMDYNFR
jgi:hypothetical protein